MNKTLFYILSVILLNTANAQEKKQETKTYKFEKITAADFAVSTNIVDSAADAVIITDVGNSSFEGNSKGWFSLLYNHRQRIKILNKNGLDAATFAIHLYYTSGAEEKLDRLRATTYNLENGVVTETKLDGASIFKDKISKKYNATKFTMPAVKVGSIIDVEYTIQSDFLFNLQSWTFQGQYPRLWSEYTVDMPEFFNYVVLFQGYQNLFDKAIKSNSASYNVMDQGGSQRSETYHISAGVTSTRWMMKNVPALKQEPFTTSLSNHLSKLDFQLSQYRFPNEPVEDKMPNWFKVSEALMKDDEFGAHLSDGNSWLSDDIKIITAGATTKLEKAKKIYAWLRDNFTCTNYNRYYMSNTLKTTFKNKSGTVADINLLLTAMLIHENINALPVILSTRDNGFTHQMYPLMDRFNYVICTAEIDDIKYNLDAAIPRLGFGKLDANCYNGHARTIEKELAAATYFNADSLKESKFSSIFIVNDDKGKWVGSFSSQLGDYESLNLRNRIKKSGKDEFNKKLKSQMPTEMEIENIELDSLEQFDNAVTVKYDFNLTGNTDDILYFNPMMSEAYKENMFKAATRLYPVEMPYTTDEILVINIEAPNGYMIDEVPKSVRVNLNEDDGSFEYLTSRNDSTVLVRSHIKIKKANFPTEDYQTLRDFFAYVVKKQSEQIVFKKKKQP